MWIDQHIRLLESIPPSQVNPFTRSEDESVSGMVVGVVRSACRVNLSRLDSGTLHSLITLHDSLGPIDSCPIQESSAVEFLA
jgi:hypothetical protein